MDSFSQILSQCHLDSAKVMDPSADNFYVCEEKQQFTIKQEPFDIEDSNVGLVGDFLQSEDSIDIDAYLALGRAEVQQNNHVSNTGDGILRQLEQDFASNHQQMLTHTPAPTPGAQPNQQPVHSVDQLHYTINNMPQQNTQAHVVEQAVPEYQPCWEIHSTSNSAASSPGLPTSGDSYNEEVQIQADSGTASGSGGGSQKRKRPVPTPGTHEYKQKRERNNIAVRKSREKTKTKNKELQDKVGELQEENTGLKKRVEGLAKELAVLRSLFTTTGKTPPSALDKAVK
ncbi:CCAAT/enhancer-binding protein alpha [Strongylocentrotus purpuratus]|uniref:BZIP domain-containing protein n=1 Tax=Strongylocentrotus purpuratus TaxID=7668 RepID=A0A7M7GP96_STRPU|nr:CCAAT/enhancer-binding protein alpha [Strongylocentrotus purpuratus]